MDGDFYQEVVTGLKEGRQFKRCSEMTIQERTLKLAIDTFQLDPLDKLVFIDEHPIHGITMKYAVKKSEIPIIIGAAS